MGFSPFIEPETVRLPLVDVHRRAYDELKKQTVFPNTSIPRSATPEELTAAEAAIRVAEERSLYVDVKKELTAGEYNDMLSDMAVEGGFEAGTRPKLDVRKVGMTKVHQYVVGWNFLDAKGRPVPVSESAFRNLSQEIYSEIVRAVDWHDDQVDKAREARKNGSGIASESLAT